MLTLKCLQGKTVIVDGSSVKIFKKAGRFSSERDKVIPIRNITSVEVKEPGFIAGHVKFSIAGGPRNASYLILGGVELARADENSVVFRGTESYDIALKMKKYIEEYKEESPSVANVSAADEILKLKALMDDGIITLEEFNAKKKLLLGI